MFKEKLCSVKKVEMTYNFVSLFLILSFYCILVTEKDKKEPGYIEQT